ncbi:MAG: phosphonoacetate hydrolase [Bacteriovoracaceae bacterium]
MSKKVTFEVNGRSYNPPNTPIVVICIDGCADEYLSAAIVKGYLPNIAKMSKQGHHGLARGALPSFTNVNNCSICTGVSPLKTGICGNYFLNPETGEEVMMNDPKFLRVPTILAAAAKAGRKVGFVTAKDKLRKILSKDLKGIAFSSEFASKATIEENGIDNVTQLMGDANPDIYSAEASIFVIKAGVMLLKEKKADFLYLSTTDYIQHKYMPEAPEALEFYREIDSQIGELLNMGAIVGITADHGMNAKHDVSGKPNIIYLETILEKKFGKDVKVVCPITDPYVVHHGALGGAVTVHIKDKAKVNEVANFIMNIEGITEVHNKEMSEKKLELAQDRIGDLLLAARTWY